MSTYYAANRKPGEFVKLKEFLDKYKIDKTKFAAKLDTNAATIYHYMSGRNKPRQKLAERIEKETDGLVTVMELRGKDDRNKKRKADSIPSEQDVRGENQVSDIPSN